MIARQRALDFCKAKYNDDIHLSNELMLAVEGDAPDDTVIGHDAYDKILEAIRSLSDTYRDVCILKYVYDFKEREIAAILDLNPKTVNIRIHRGKQILRKSLRKENLHE